jgi:hypothetical protein
MRWHCGFAFKLHTGESGAQDRASHSLIISFVLVLYIDLRDYLHHFITILNVYKTYFMYNS